MFEKRFDVIVIGSGAGGGTLAHRLASAGADVLLLERGTFLPKEKQNWDTLEVFGKDRYHTSEKWLDRKGQPFRPGMGYWVGGNTKVYGAALLRLRDRDFQELRHRGGISPAWPLNSGDFAPYYDQAEQLYGVHGHRGGDPTEPASETPYPEPPVSHEPVVAALAEKLEAKGLRPFHLPLGVRLNEVDRELSACARCDTCDGFPCLVDAKADADLCAVRPIMNKSNVTLLTGAKVTRLHTSATGREINAVEAEILGKSLLFRADVIVLSAGALNSAVLLLRSQNEAHPRGLANSSGLVGRNFMRHVNGALLAVSLQKNPTVFQKTLAVNDFYFGDGEDEFPLGHVQLLGKANWQMLSLDAPKLAPRFVLNWMAQHSIDWWLTVEDLPDPANRVRLDGDRIVLDYQENNSKTFDRLLKKWIGILKSVDRKMPWMPTSFYLAKKIPLAGVAHQVGTCRFGEDPKTAVLDVDCRAHDVDNLYVVDGSFFPSSAAVNPSLTIMANALRVADVITKRLGRTASARSTTQRMGAVS